MGDALRTPQGPTGVSPRSLRHPREELDKTHEYQELQKSEESKSHKRTQKPVFTLEAVPPNADLDVSECMWGEGETDRQTERGYEWMNGRQGW